MNPAAAPDAPAAGERPVRSERSLRWHSQDYAVLRRRAQAGFAYDVLIVGSGYGGAMAAWSFAGLRKANGDAVQVCVLERGQEYAPGMFPSSLQELPPHVRVHRRDRDTILGQPDALLDVRVGPDVCALVGNGLGGTSLINAGVMEPPRWRADQAVPAALRRDLEDPGFLDTLKKALHATDTLARDNPVLQGERLAKARALLKVADGGQRKYHDAAITVQTLPGDPDVPPCTLCGDCMTGCNVGAKRSLDTTLLAQAAQAGVDLYTGATVLRLEPHPEGGWWVHTVFTDDSARRRHEPQPVRAHKVILAAGTFGSTEILKRSRRQVALSEAKLGTGFSCNGDNLIAVHGTRNVTNTTTDETVPLAERRVGPTITGVVAIEDGPLLEEFSVPAPLKRLFDESVTTGRLLQRLARWPGRTPGQQRHGLDSMAVDPDAMARTLLVGVVGHDEAAGTIVVPEDCEVEGTAGVLWPQAGDSPMVNRAYEQACAALRRATPPEADILPNPLWQPVPQEMAALVKERGPLLTVHPLGGCPMAAAAEDGVVNEFGQVFRGAAGDAVYADLAVLDGSILPGSVGSNPALTIAGVAFRAAKVLAQQWDWSAPPSDAQAGQAQAERLLIEPPLVTTPSQLAPPAFAGARTRPEYRSPAQCTPSPARRRTRVELMERLAGAAGAQGEYWVELTLCYQHADLADLTGQASRTVTLDESRSWLRIYDNARHDARRRLMTLAEADRTAQARFAAPLAGSLTIGEPGSGLERFFWSLRAAGAWLVNRGTRELWDVARGRFEQKFNPLSFFRSAGRAGERRVFSYDMVVKAGSGDPLLAPGARVRGSKCLTYSLRSNPWHQLLRLHLQDFPLGPADPVLQVDARFVAKQGVPLLRVIAQENQVLALADFASFLLCWLRMLVSIHLWSFRAPDPMPPRTGRSQGPTRPDNDSRLLPRLIPGVAAPQKKWLALEDDAHSPVFASALLTRYPRPGRPPVVLLHGYSASGSTFTHDAIPEPLARYLWNQDRDVWVLDMRTSAGMATARQPWHFEDAAFAELPLALDHVAQTTGQPVGVFAHCIGAVMLSMALLTDPADLDRFRNGRGDRPTPKRFAAELQRLKGNIGRIVLSQKGPMLVYCDDNVARAYFMRALRKLVFPDDYQFEVQPDATLARSLMDRVLATLPYPPEEFARENPWVPWQRAPWAGFRHRMDALYARDFSLLHLEDRTLAAITELFGPLNLDTVAQAIHFARRNTITDRTGRPFDTSGPVLAARWPRGGTVSIHGCDNGLVDVKTVDAMRAQMAFAGVPYDAVEIAGYGHQDCLLGRDAARDVFPHIAANL